MCNRAAALVKVEALGQLKLSHFEDGVLPRPNIAPTDSMPVIVHDNAGGLQLVSAVWGKPGTDFSTMNARADRLLESPAWRPLVQSKSTRGVAILSHGFEPFTNTTVEQMGRDLAVANIGAAAVAEAEGGKTVWHGIKRRDGQPMMITALVDIDPESQKRWLTLFTTEAGPVFSRIHRAKAHGEPREIASLRDAHEANEWMSGTLDYGHLLRGADETFMESWRCPPDAMKQDADPLLKTKLWKQPQRSLF